MTTGWKQAKELRDRADGRFVRLNDAGTVGTICGEPFAREVVWFNNRIVTYDKRIHSEKPRAWFAFNFYDAAMQEIRLLEGPKELFDEIVKAADEHGLDKKTFLFQRFAGSPGKKAEFKVTAGHDIDETLAAFIVSLELMNLAQEVGGQTSAGSAGTGAPNGSAAPPPQPPPQAPQAPARPAPAPAPAPPAPAPPADGGDTIEIEMAKEIAERLKALPPDKAKGFLPALGAERLSTIARASTARAFELLVELEGGPGDDGIPF